MVVNYKGILDKVRGVKKLSWIILIGSASVGLSFFLCLG